MGSWLRSTLLLAVALLLAAPALGAAGESAATSSDAETAAQVKALLGAIDSRIPAARWQALGAAAVTPLTAVATDTSALPSRRARAVHALSEVGGARATALVQQLAASETAPFVVRASALRGLPNLVTEAELTSRLQPVLQGATSVSVRAVAAQVLARHAATGCAAVRTQAARERAADRPAFTAALQTCGS